METPEKRLLLKGGADWDGRTNAYRPGFPQMAFLTASNCAECLPDHAWREVRKVTARNGNGAAQFQAILRSKRA
jgi:hypothetical protein